MKMRIMSAICLMGAVMMVGCGSKTTEVITNETLPVEVDAEATVTEEVVDEGIETEVTEAITVVEETAEAEATTAEESTTEEISQESEQPLTIRDVEEKMERLILANNVATDFIESIEDEEVRQDERNFYGAAQSFTFSKELGHILTKDGITIIKDDDYKFETKLNVSALAKYYYDFINGKTNNYYLLSDYVRNHTADEIINYVDTNIEFYETLNNGKYETIGDIYDIDTVMCCAMGLPIYFRKAESITYGDIIVGNENVTTKSNSLIPVEYEVPIYVNGETESMLSMVFDKDKNMLNIVASPDFPIENYIGAYAVIE